MASLRFAAANGHRAAQSLYGRTLFGALFTSHAPEPGERGAYVSALTFLRVAARAGDARASHFIPALAAARVSSLEPPLGGVPREWVEAAVEAADAWIECHGLPGP